MPRAVNKNSLYHSMISVFWFFPL